MDALHGAQRRQVHDTLVAAQHDVGETADHLDADLGAILHQALEDQRPDRREPAIGNRDNARRARIVAERGKLAEVVALADVGEGDLAAARREIDDAHRAIDDEIDVVAILAPDVQDHLVGGVFGPDALLLERIEHRLAEPL